MNRQVDIVKNTILRGLMAACIAIVVMLPLQASSQTQTLVSKKMPAIEVVGIGELQRMSENKDKSGLLLPPWKSVEVTNVFGFDIQPRVDTRATFVPLGIDLDQFDLKLKLATLREGCAKSSSKWWVTEFQPVTDPRLFDIRALPGRSEEFPFDVVVIYPAVSAAREIPRSEIRPEMLPRRVKLETVKAAVDVTSDGMPDIVITEYCCANGATTVGCDLTCGATYKRSGRSWKKIDKSTPC